LYEKWIHIIIRVDKKKVAKILSFFAQYLKSA